MTTQLGRGPSRAAAPADAVDSLLECHARMRSFGATARRLALAGAIDPETVRDAAERVARYLRQAVPLHVRDEEESVLPRLRGRAAELDAALAAMATEHDAHEAHVAAVASLCERLAAAPTEHAALRAELAAHATELESAWIAHLAREESVVLPAMRRLLSAAELAAILDEMRARRR